MYFLCEQKVDFMDKSGKYYIVKERALPEVLLKVVEAKRLIDSEKAMTVQEATDATGISRSSFYKYKDDIIPFHENVHSPAAHLHTDSNRLWCYSEQRMYGSWDVYKVYYPKIDTNKLAEAIVNKIGIEEIENRLGQIENKNEIPFLKDLDKFKERKDKL